MAKGADRALQKEAAAFSEEFLRGYVQHVAGEDAKAQAANDAQQKLAMNKMQPQLDQMKQQAEQLQKEFSDPAKVQAMKDQALAMKKSMQQQQANAKEQRKEGGRSGEELGL